MQNMYMYKIVCICKLWSVWWKIVMIKIVWKTVCLLYTLGNEWNEIELNIELFSFQSTPPAALAVRALSLSSVSCYVTSLHTSRGNVSVSAPWLAGPSLRAEHLQLFEFFYIMNAFILTFTFDAFFCLFCEVNLSWGVGNFDRPGPGIG